MDERLQRDLLRCDTDIDGAIKRLSDNEDLYIVCLKGFLSDTTMTDLIGAVREHEWDSAFTAVHALKGLAANLGLIPLYQSVGEFVILIRKGKIQEIDDGLYKVSNCYEKVIDVLNDNFKDK